MVDLYQSDNDIVKDVLQGKAEAFRELVTRYKKAIFSLCFRMVQNNEEAEDLSQEVFIKVYQNLNKYDEAFKFSTWILKIATNTSIDYLRKKRVDTIPLEDGIESKQDMASAESIYFHQDNKLVIERMIQELPEEYRLLIILYHQQGLSYKEISDNVNIPMSKVKNRLHRARNILKDQLKVIKEEEAQWTAKQVQI